MSLLNTIMLAATPLLPQGITAYNYNSIEELNSNCYRINYSIDGIYNTPIEFLTINDTKNYTAVFYCRENYSQTQENSNRVEVSESNLFWFGSEANFWKSLLELNEQSENNYYSIVCDGQIDFSVVVQKQRIDNYDVGYQSGYNEGYSAAIQEGKVGSYNWLISAFDTLKKIFEIEMLPNLKLGYLLGIPFVIILVRFVLSWFR